MSAVNDRAPLAGLVAYEQQVLFGYEVTLAQAPLDPAQRKTIESFRAQSAQSAATLRKALRAVGGTPSPPPNPAQAPQATDPSLRGYLRDVVIAEEQAVQAYYDAFQSLADPRHIAGAAAFMAQSGRRLVVLRKLSGQELLPRSFETGGA